MTATVSSLLAAEGSSFSILPVMVLLPLLGAIIIGLTPSDRPELHRLTAIATAVCTGVLSLVVLFQFDAEDPGFQFVTSVTWVETYDIKFALGIDGISLFLVVLTGIMFPISMLATKPDHSEKGYWFWLTLLEVGCMGVFCALDLFLFFLFFEVTLVPLYMLIGKWGHGRKVYAATKFFVFTMAGSMIMLVSIVALAYYAKAGDGGTISFDLQRVVASDVIPEGTARLIFVGFMIAFMVKTPVFPLHTWLPDAHTEAPTAGSVDLAAVLLKLGTYGFLRYGLFLFPEASVWAAPVMVAVGTVGIVYGGVVAAMQRNLKRLVAYSSVSHMGFCIIGLFALNTQGIQGSVMQMVNHGITTGALFILLGFLYKRRHTYEIAELKGIQKVAPVFAGLFTLMMLASIGLPGLNGFVGEFLSLLGTFLAFEWWALIPTTGVILAALYLLWAYQRVFHGEPDEANSRFGDLKLTERLIMVPLVFLVVFLGVYPKPVLDRIEPSVNALVEHVERNVPGWRSPESENGRDLRPVEGRLEAGGHGEGEAEGHDADESGAADAGGGQ